jgi:hypothetical protein
MGGRNDKENNQNKSNEDVVFYVKKEKKIPWVVADFDRFFSKGSFF